MPHRRLGVLPQDRVPAAGPDDGGEPRQERHARLQDPHLLRQDLPRVCGQQGKEGHDMRIPGKEDHVKRSILYVVFVLPILGDG